LVISWQFGIYFGIFIVICYFCGHFGLLCQNKSGNPDLDTNREKWFLRARIKVHDCCVAQDGPIGLIFAQWTIVYFGQFSKNHR
jgi:hypothetical protein